MTNLEGLAQARVEKRPRPYQTDAEIHQSYIKATSGGGAEGGEDEQEVDDEPSAAHGEEKAVMTAAGVVMGLACICLLLAALAYWARTAEGSCRTWLLDPLLDDEEDDNGTNELIRPMNPWSSNSEGRSAADSSGGGDVTSFSSGPQNGYTPVPLSTVTLPPATTDGFMVLIGEVEEDQDHEALTDIHLTNDGHIQESHDHNRSLPGKDKVPVSAALVLQQQLDRYRSNGSSDDSDDDAVV